MTATYDTLPLDARLAGVLEGWVGPVDVHWRSGMDRWAPSACYGGRVLTDTTGALTTVLLTSIRLDLHRPESLHRLADWLAAGQACPTCEGTGAHPLADAKGQTCPRCRGTGHLRPPTPMWWPLPRELGGTLPALWSRQVLGWSAESVARGGPAIVGVLGAPCHPCPFCAYPLRPHIHGARSRDVAWRDWSGEWYAVATGDGDREAVRAGYAFAPAAEDEPLTLPPLLETTT